MSARLSSWFQPRDGDAARCATVAVARDAYGVVLLASPDGERFRTVNRLAMTAAEARTLYDTSTAPTLWAHDLVHHFGEQIAKLQLGRM